MKKILIPLAFILFLGGVGAASLAPVRKDDKPIVVEKMCYAEEIVEYETEDNLILGDEVEDCDECATICVRGKSVSAVSPDSATIFAVIENMGADMKNSKDENYSVFDKVIASLKNIGAVEEEISLQYFSCSPYYDYTNGKTLQGYITSTSFSVKVGDVKRIKDYVDTMTENGISSICNIQYELSTLDEEYSSALSSAYENAKQKAKNLLGKEELKLVKIREEMVFASSSLARNYAENISADLIGKIEIQACVWAEFEA